MKKKITLQETPTEVEIHSLCKNSITFSLAAASYSFEVVHRFSARELILRSIETGQHYSASVGIPSKSGTSTIQLKSKEVTIRPITRNSQGTPTTSDYGPNAVAPLSGIIRTIKVNKGDTVTEGMTVAIIEAMKMQMPIEAHAGGKVVAIHVSEGEEVREGALLIEISDLNIL
jgi:biotin carboxyl carrier protein